MTKDICPICNERSDFTQKSGFLGPAIMHATGLNIAGGLETINEQRPSSNLNPQVLQALANSLGELSPEARLKPLQL